MSRQIFRKAALERLQSPEQLDQMIEVTTRKGWLSLYATLLVIVTALLWGIFGSVPKKVSGKGLLVKSGGVFKISTSFGGTISELRKRVGETVTKGEVVALLEQWELAEEIQATESKLPELIEKRDRSLEFATKNHTLQREHLQEQRDLVATSIAAAKQNVGLQEQLMGEQLEIIQNSIGILNGRLQWLEEKVAAQEQLFAQGLVTKQTVLNTKEQYNSTSEEIKKLKAQAKHEKINHDLRLAAAQEKDQELQNRLRQLEIKESELQREFELQSLTFAQQIGEMERRIDSMKERLKLHTTVVSNYSGRILEVSVSEGDRITSGSTVFTMELSRESSPQTELVLYVPSADGKKIIKGMEVQISPSTVKKEEFGFLRGKVESVGLFPVTPAGMMRVLGNSSLVAEMSTAGSPIEIIVDLVEDQNSLSGYQWSSPIGPPIKIYSGTLCEAQVEVRRLRPISLVIPIIKEKLGL